MTKDTPLTFDYQLLTNPAYNADRGPGSILPRGCIGRSRAERKSPAV